MWERVLGNHILWLVAMVRAVLCSALFVGRRILSCVWHLLVGLVKQGSGLVIVHYTVHLAGSPLTSMSLPPSWPVTRSSGWLSGAGRSHLHVPVPLLACHLVVGLVEWRGASTPACPCLTPGLAFGCAG